MKQKSHISLYLITLLSMVAFIGTTAMAATRTWVPTAGGAWTTAANWGGTVPATGDDVIIPADQSANITAVPTITLNSLTINGTCTFASAANGNTITISTTFSVAASKTFTLNNTNGTRPNITLAATATGTVNGTVTEGNAANTFTNNGTLIMPPAGIISGAGVFVNAATATLQVGSTAGITTAGATGNIQTTTRTYTAGANYIYNGTAAQVTGNGLTSTTPLNLTINNSAGVTLSAATTISNNLSVLNGTLADGGFQITGNGTGTLNVASGATLQIGAGAGNTETFPTLYTTANITLGATSTIIYNSTSAMTVAGSVASVGPSTYGNLTLSGNSTKTAASAITVVGNLAINAGTFADGGYTITVNGNVTNNATHSGAGKILMSSSNAQTIGGATNTFGNLEFNNSNASGVVFSNTTTTTSVSGNIVVSGGTLFVGSFATSLTVTGTTSVTGTLTINNATGSKTFTGDVTINSGGTFNATAVAVAINFGGNITNNGTSFDLSASTGTTSLNGATKTLGGNPLSFGLLTIGGATAINAGTTVNVSGTFTISAALTNNGTLNSTGTSAIAGASSIANASGGSFSLANTSITGTIIPAASANLVTYTGTAAQTIKVPTTNPYFNLTVDKSSNTATLGGAFTVSGNLTINNGTLADGGYQITGNATGTLNVANGATLQIGAAGANTETFPTLYTTAHITLGATSTVIFNSTSAMTVAGSVASVGPSTYGNLTLSSASTKTAASAITVAGNLTINAGTFADGGFTITVNGDVANSGTHSGAGNITMTGGSGSHDVSGGTSTFGTLILNDATNGGTMTGTGATTVGTLTVTAGTLTLNSFATSLTVTTTNVTGTLTFNNATGTRSMGAVTVNTGGVVNVTVAPSSLTVTDLSVTGTWNNSANAAISIGGNLTVNTGATFTAGSGAYTFTGTTKTIGGTLGTISIPSISISVSVTNNLTTAPGLNISTTFAGAGTLTQGTNAILTIGAATVTPTLTATASGNLVTYNSTTGGQTISGTTYYNLTIDKSTQTGTLGAATTISNNLKLTSGSITTGSYTLIVANSATSAVSQTSGQVVGNLQRAIATGVNTYTFDVGTSSSYTPVSVNFASVTTAGNLTASVTSGQEPNTGSPVDGSNDVGLYWTLTNSGIAFTTYSPTFTYNGSDIIGGSNNTGFIVGKYTASVWTSPTPVTNAGSGPYTTQVSGLNNFSDFVVGSAFTTSATDYFRSNATGNWSNASNWQSSHDNIHWSTATLAPTNSAALITIQSPNNITIDVNNQTASSITINSGGTLTNSTTNTLIVSGNWTNNGGTFTRATGTVTFNGTTQTIGGSASTTFYNLSTSGITNTSTGIATTIGGNLSIGDGTTFTSNATYAFTVTGAITVGGGTGGTLAISTAATNTQIFTGAVTINSGANFTENVAATLSFGSDVTINGTLTENGAAVVSIAGSFTNNGTYTASTGVHTFSGATKTIGGTNSISIPTATFTGAYTNSGTLTVGTLLTVTTVTLTNNGTITASTALSGSGGLTQGTTGILNIGAASAITTLTANAVGNTVNYTGAAQTAKVTTYSNLTLSGSGAKTFATTPTVNNVLSLEGTASVVVTTGVVTYGTNATLQYNKPAPYTATAEEWITPFAATGGIIIANTGAITTYAALTLSAGVPLTINTGATLITGANNAWTLTVGGTTSVSGTLTLANTGTVTFTGAVTINSGGAITESAAATLSFGSDVTINGGTLTENTNVTVGIAGSLTNNGTYTASTGVHTFSGATKTIGGTNPISIPTATFTGAYTNSGTLTVGTLLTVTTVTLTNNGTITASTALSGSGGLTQGTTGILNIGAASAITTLTATAIGNTVNYTGTGQTLKVIAYHHLTLSGGAETFGAIATVGGNLTLSGSATASLGANLAVGGNLSVGDGTTLTVGAYTFGITGTTTVGNGTSGILSISSATGTKTFTGAVTINAGGAVTETAAAQLAFGSDVIISGTLTESGAAVVGIAGSLTNNGTYTASTGVHTFSGVTKTIGGTNPISIPTVTFTGAYTNSGTLTVGTLLTVTTVTLTNNGTITASTALSGTGGVTQGTTGVLNIGGTSGITTLAASVVGNTVNYTGAGAQTIPGITYYDLGFSGAGTKTIAAGTTITVGRNWAVGSATTMTTTANAAVTGNITGTGAITMGSGTITIGGDWTNSGTLAAGTGTINYNGSYVGQIVVGGVTYYNLQISNGGTKNLTGGSATVSNVLTLNSGIFEISNNNLILSNTIAAAITGTYSTTTMIQTSGAGYLQKAGGSGGTGIGIVYPIGSGGYYNPLDLTIGGFTASGTTGNLQISATTVNQGANALSKYWTLTISAGYSAIVTKLRFTYNNAEAPGGRSQYDTWYNSSSSWVSAPGTHTALAANPFGTDTSGASAGSISGKWTAGSSAPATSNTYYSYQSGDWNNASSWTSDPSGTTLVNSGVPANSDIVTILNGRTISISANNKQVNSLTLNSGGILDIGSTTGHNFGTVSGQGKIKLSSNTFPGGTYTSFVASGGGTIEFYNLNGVSIPATPSPTFFTYNNLIISNNTTSANSSYFINSTSPTTYTINGNLSLKNYSSGTQTLFFGNPTASDNLINMTVYGDFTADAGCNVRVNNFATSHAIPNANDEGATAYPVHSLSLYGNLTNNGSIRFTGLPSPDTTAYYILTTTASGGVNYGDVQVFFYGATNNTVTCNGITDFYRLIVAKGIDKTYTVEVSSSNTSNFALYAPNNQGNSNFNGGTNGYGYGAYYKALFIHYGTLKLDANINVPSLTEGGQDFNIIPTAELWVNGATVSTTVSGFNGTGYQAATLYGTLRISGGQFSMGDAAGMVLGTLGTPVIMIEGTGTLDVSQVWTSTGGTNQMSYIQTGGTANFRLLGENHAGPMFGLSNVNSSFTMSGGTINFTNNTFADATTDFQIMDVESQAGNYNVTGGTININLPSSTTVYTANSTVPFYNVNISNRTGTLTTTVQWNTPGSSLSVLHDLTIGNLSVLNLNTSTISLNVGHNFTISSGGTYTPSTTSTTTFNGAGAQAFNNVGTIIGGLNNLTITNSSLTSIINNNVTVNGALFIDQNSVLNDSGETVTVYGNIINSGTHISRVSTGAIILTGTAAQTLSGNGTGIFNNLTLNKTGGSVTATANMAVTGNLRLAGTTAGVWNILNIGSYRLALGANSMVYSNGTIGTTFDNNKMIQTSGLLSDGGVSKTYASTLAFVFPFGFYTNATYYYMPHSIQFTIAPTAYGTVTTRPVNGRHPLAQGSNNALTCYWKATSTGFTGIQASSVINIYYYDYAQSNYFVAGTEGNYVPALYNGSSWSSLSTSGVNTTTNQVTYNANIADGEYTAGDPATAFGTIPTLYSVVNGPWNNANTWSTTRGGAGGGGTPTAGTLVIICSPYTVTTPVAASSSILTIESGSTLDLGNINGHSFGSISICSGTLRIASSTYFPAGDWGNFLGPSGGTVEYYQTAAGTLTLPTTYTLPGGGTANITGYYNLSTSPYNASNIILPNSNLTIYNNLTAGCSSGGGTSNCITQINAGASSTTLEVKGNININQYGILQYQNNLAEYVIADNDINIASGGALQVRNGGNSVANTLTVYGNIINNGTFDLDSNYPTNDNYYCTLIFTGSLSKSLTSTSTPTRTRLYGITVNKGTSRDSILNVNVDPTGFQMGGGGLNLQNGTFRLTSSVTMPLSTGGFSIPSTACLSANGGTFNIATGAAAADLSLVGRLEILAGAVNIGPAIASASANAFNTVYASAGTPEIIISGGSLYVYSQIRRGTGTTSGSLNYTQTGGTVTVGGKNASTSRAVFEVLNDGIFTMSNGTLIIANHITANTPYDLYLDPGTELVTGGTIQFGLSGVTPASTLFYFQSSCSIGNLTLEATTKSSAIQEIYQLTLEGSLTIGGISSYYNTNGLDVTIGGNLINNNTTSTVGLNVGGYQTQVLTQSTGFVGSTDQTITGTTSPSNITNFANLDVSTATGHSISLSSSNITINGDLTLTSGTLNDNGNTIALLNNVDNNAAHYSSSTSGGMIFKGTADQGITGSGNGVFGNIEINNSGYGVNMTDNSTINGQLKFTNGNLYIDNYSLTFGQSVTIVGANGTNHIILNGVSGDIGVTKIFPNGASSFTYPIGANGKYTPCTYNFTANTNAAGATINVVPIDDLHPSVNPASYTNYLNYYWKVVTTGFSPATYNVTHSYTYIPADVTGNPANIERCNNSTSAWTTVTPGTISSPTFSFSSTTLLDGSYTIGDQFISLPILYSTKSGNWNDATVWSPSFVPNGHSVVINAPHTVTLSVNGAIASSVDIEGVLDATNTVSHNIGQVSGTGRIRMSPTGSAIFIFPGGSYDAFLVNSTSTVEFYGNTDGTMPLNPGNINKPYQQVIFSGTGKKYISSVDTKINGNLTISDGSKLDNTLYNKDLFVLGNWIDQNMSIAGFTAGTGAVHFSGSAAQSILMSGNSMKETFYDLEINNAAGLTINTGAVDISDQFLLTLGNINFASITNNILTITNTSSSAVVGGSINSFVNGPLSKKIINGSSFQFPVGDANSSSRNRIGYISVNSTSTSGTQTWTAQFFDKDPTTVGYNITQMVSPLQSVVNNEYWNIIGPSGGSANVVLSWDQYTGMSSSASTRALSRVAEWLSPWNSVGQVVTDNGQASGTVATSTLVNLDNHFFTIGGINIMPLLITSIANGDWNNAATWNYRVPMSIDTVHISNSFAVTLNNSVTITNLIVDNGGSFDNNNSFSVTNNVYIGSGSNLKIESGASISAGKIIINGGANYINLSSSAPTLQVMCTISGTEGWRMLAAPDKITVSSMFAGNFVTQGFTGSSYPSLQPNLMWWDETSQGTSLQAWRQPSNSTDTVKLGRGYMYYVFNGALRPDVASNYSDVLPLTMTATGTENLLTSAFDFGVTATTRSASSHDTTFVDTNAVDYGWNLVGNPTPSTINWNAGSGWTKTNMDGTIYIWDPATSNYKYWNGSTGNITGGLITPFQAFWVKANAASPSLKCDNGVKTTGGNFLGKKSAGTGTLASVSSDSAGKKSTSIVKPASLAKDTSDKKSLGINDSAPVLELELSANGLQTQAYLMFSPSGKITYDPYDAFSLVPLSDNYLILYSVAGTGQPAMQIQNLPDTGFVQPFTLPLYLGGTVGGQPFNGSFTLSWNLNGQLPVGWSILLMDDVSGTATSMIEAGDLTFQYNTPADLISSSSSLLQKESSVASNRQSLHALPRPVVQTVPAAKLAKSSTSASRFRLVVSANNNLTGYLPTTPQLAQNYPNPFNPTTNITFSIPAQTRVTIRVFNILGQQVATVTDQEYSAGNHLVVWNASNVASGVYFCRMTAAEKTQTKKMVVLR